MRTSHLSLHISKNKILGLREVKNTKLKSFAKSFCERILYHIAQKCVLNVYILNIMFVNNLNTSKFEGIIN